MTLLCKLLIGSQLVMSSLFSIGICQAPEPPKIEIPIMLQKIGWCESENKQFNPDGSVLRGKINPRDLGKFQINLDFHEQKAKELGFDLFLEKDNEAYALYLFYSVGTSPWNWSKNCWVKIPDNSPLLPANQ